MSKYVLASLALSFALTEAFGQVLDPSLAFNGVWQREDHAETISISISGNSALITTSNGASGPGKFNGDTIEYAGGIQTDAGPVKTTGTFQLGDDGNSLIKHRQIYYESGTQQETSTYIRVTSTPLAFAPTPSPTPTPTPTPLATPAPTPTPVPFVGVWRPADDSAKLTITISGRSAVLKYSPGSRDTGTVQGNKVETETATQSDGIKTSDVFEMSSNGRTLIRRRTLVSRSGEIGHETLTYDHAEVISSPPEPHL